MVIIAKSHYFYEIQRNWNTLIKKVVPSLSKDTLLMHLKEITRPLHEVEILNSFLAKLRHSVPKKPSSDFRFFRIPEEDIMLPLFRDIQRYGLMTYSKKEYPGEYLKYPKMTFLPNNLHMTLPFCCTEIVTEWPLLIPSNFCLISFDVDGGRSDEHNVSGIAVVVILKSLDDFDYGSRVPSILSTEVFHSKESGRQTIKIENFKGHWFHIAMKLTYNGSLRWGGAVDEQVWSKCQLNMTDMKIIDEIEDSRVFLIIDTLKREKFTDVDIFTT